MNTPQSARQRRRQIDSGSLSSDSHLQDQAVAENCQVGANDESTRDKRHSPNPQLCAGSASPVGTKPECHLLKLPTELRQEIFKYLMPVRPIGSLIVYNADWNTNIGTIVTSGALRTRLPVPLLDLSLGFNCEIFEDVKDVLYSTATFAIDITRDGVTLCGQRILLPSGKDGYVYQNRDQGAIDRFIRNFNWSAVKNYTIKIVFGRQECAEDPRMGMCSYDNEIELYDMCDYVSIVVSGVLAKARKLNNLSVSVEIKDSRQLPPNAIDNAILLLAPFRRLRRVTKPHFMGVFHDRTQAPAHVHIHEGSRHPPTHCSGRHMTQPSAVFVSGMTDFDVFAADWRRTLASDAPSAVVPQSPMTKLFLAFKTLHEKLMCAMPQAVRVGRQCFLHRARVARVQEDVGGFRAVVADLLACWRRHLQDQDRERREVNFALQSMLDADLYLREEQVRVIEEK